MARTPTTTQPQGLLNPALAGQPQQFAPTDEQTKALHDWWLQYGGNAASAAQQSQWNRVNESGPYGGASYTTGPDGQVTRNYSLNPWEQTKYSQEAWLDMEKNKAAGDMSGQLSQYSQPFQYQNLIGISGADPSARQGIEEQLYNFDKRRLDQQWADKKAQLDQEVMNRGLTPGSKGYQALYDQFNRDQSEAYTGARESAYTRAGSEMQNQFNQNLTGRQQQIGEQNYLRANPMNEYFQMRTPVQSGVNNPQVAGVSQLQFTGPEIAGASQGYQQLTNQNAAMKGGGGGGGRGSSGGGGLDLNAPINYTPPASSSSGNKTARTNISGRRGLMALAG